MIFEVRPFGPLGTNSLLLAESTGKKAYIFDAPQGSCEYWKHRAKELSLTIAGLFLTHSHWDHTADAAEIKKTFQLEIWVHPDDARNVREPGSDGLPLYFPITGVEADHLLRDGQKIAIEGFTLDVIHTPGHTPGGVCFYLPKEEILISGDTLFKETIGRLDLPTSRPALMKNSLQKLLQLPGKTKVFPGHGDPTTIEEEKMMMQYLCQEEL